MYFQSSLCRKISMKKWLSSQVWQSTFNFLTNKNFSQTWPDSWRRSSFRKGSSSTTTSRRWSWRRTPGSWKQNWCGRTSWSGEQFGESWEMRDERWMRAERWEWDVSYAGNTMRSSESGRRCSLTLRLVSSLLYFIVQFILSSVNFFPLSSPF